MSESIKAFLSLGSKFCPNELDIDRAMLEKDLESWFRRFRLKAHFDDKEDNRTVEEQNFTRKVTGLLSLESLLLWICLYFE